MKLCAPILLALVTACASNDTHCLRIINDSAAREHIWCLDEPIIDALDDAAKPMAGRAE